MAGLCAGLVLRDVGCAVEIFEKSPREMQERGAGLVVHEEVLASSLTTAAPPPKISACVRA